MRIDNNYLDVIKRVRKFQQGGNIYVGTPKPYTLNGLTKVDISPLTLQNAPVKIDVSGIQKQISQEKDLAFKREELAFKYAELDYKTGKQYMDIAKDVIRSAQELGLAMFKSGDIGGGPRWEEVMNKFNADTEASMKMIGEGVDSKDINKVFKGATQKILTVTDTGFLNMKAELSAINKVVKEAITNPNLGSAGALLDIFNYTHGTRTPVEVPPATGQPTGDGTGVTPMPGTAPTGLTPATTNVIDPNLNFRDVISGAMASIQAGVRGSDVNKLLGEYKQLAKPTKVTERTGEMNQYGQVLEKTSYNQITVDELYNHIVNDAKTNPFASYNLRGIGVGPNPDDWTPEQKAEVRAYAKTFLDSYDTTGSESWVSQPQFDLMQNPDGTYSKKPKQYKEERFASDNPNYGKGKSDTKKDKNGNEVDKTGGGEISQEDMRKNLKNKAGNGMNADLASTPEMQALEDDPKTTVAAYTKRMRELIEESKGKSKIKTGATGNTGSSGGGSGSGRGKGKDGGDSEEGQVVHPGLREFILNLTSEELDLKDGDGSFALFDREVDGEDGEPTSRKYAVTNDPSLIDQFKAFELPVIKTGLTDKEVRIQMGIIPASIVPFAGASQYDTSYSTANSTIFDVTDLDEAYKKTVTGSKIGKPIAFKDYEAPSEYAPAKSGVKVTQGLAIDLINENKLLSQMTDEQKMYLAVFLDHEDIQDDMFNDYLKPKYDKIIGGLKASIPDKTSKYTDNQLYYIIHHQGGVGGSYFIRNDGAVIPSLLIVNPNAKTEIDNSLAKIGDGDVLVEVPKIESYGGDYRVINNTVPGSSPMGKWQITGKTHIEPIINYVENWLLNNGLTLSDLDSTSKPKKTKTPTQGARVDFEKETVTNPPINSRFGKALMERIKNKGK